MGEIAYSLFVCASCKDRSILDNLYLPDELVVCPMIMASAMKMLIHENQEKAGHGLVDGDCGRQPQA